MIKKYAQAIVLALLLFLAVWLDRVWSLGDTFQRAEPISISAILVSLAFSAASYAINRIFGPKPPKVTRGKMEGELFIQNASEGVGIAEVYGGSASAATQNIQWTNLTRAFINDEGNLENDNTGDDNCFTDAEFSGDSGARSVQVITGGDFEIQWTFGKDPSGRSFLGLTNGFSLEFSDWEYCMHVSTEDNVSGTPHPPNSVFVYEGLPPNKAFLDGVWSSGDTLRIRCQSGVVTYWYRDTLMYTSLNTATYPLNVVASMACHDSTVERAIIVRDPETDGGIRTAGTVIWAKPPRKVVTTEKVGGKGAPKQTVETITYYTDLAILFARGRVGIMKLEANADPILDLTTPIGTPTGAVDSGASDTTPYDQETPPSTGGDTSGEFYGLRLSEDANGVLSGTLGAGGGASMRFYEGNYDQLPDPLIQADIDGKYGAGSTPAYRGYAYLVIENFDISKYGGIPTFLAVLYNKDIGTLGVLADHLSERVGIEPGDRDFSIFDAEGIRGLIIQDPTPPRETLETATLPFGATYYESVDGLLAGRYFGNSPVLTIDNNDLGMAEGDEVGTQNNLPTEVETRIVDPVQLPREISVGAFDQAKGYEVTSQRAFLMNEFAEGVEQISLPMTLNPDEARQAAERILYQRWIARQTDNIKLPWRYGYLNPTDVITIIRNGITGRFRINQITGALPGLQEFALVADQSAVYTQTIEGDSGGGYEQPTVSVPVQSIALLVDTVMLRDADDAPGYYVAIAPRSDAASWAGAALYRDRGSGYELIDGFSTPATAGKLVSGVTSTDSNSFDEVTTITVDLYGTVATLESADELAVLNGANAAILGDAQVFQFKNAVQVGGQPNRWNLTGILWSRRGSDFSAGSHATGERFLLLDGAIKFISNDLVERNAARDFKAVTSGYSIDDTPLTVFTWAARTLMPLSPINVEGARDGSNNLTIEWVRRSRLGNDWVDLMDAPVGESILQFQIDVLDGVTVVRTITVDDDTTATYSAADQTLDGLTPGDPVDLIIYQMSSVVGRGFPRAATV